MTKSIPYSQYYQSVLGGWFGKFIGSTLGAPLEGEKVLHNRTYYDKVPDAAVWNDDNDFQVMWLMLLEEHGPNLNGRDMAKYFREQIRYPWCEYGYARKNWDQGIWPPVSGWFNNDYYRNSMGCPVRSEIWAFIHPGQPQRAVEYARIDASLDHAEESIEAEAFLAAIESMLFWEKDIRELIRKGLEWIDPKSRMAEMVRLCMDLHQRGLSWEMARHAAFNRYGHPDFTAALQNLALIVLALLYGQCDFERTILLALNGGYDSDCTCATAGAIVGAIIGAGAIPAKWKDPLNDTFKAYLKEKHELRISAFTERTCRMGVRLMQRAGAEVEITNVPKGVSVETIEKTNPVDVEFEYDGLPTLRPGVRRVVTMVLSNRTDKDIACELAVSSPQPYIAVSLKEARLLLPQCRSLRVPVTIEVQGHVTSLPQTHLFPITVRQGKTVLCDEIFGLAGEHYWEAFGAFWDVYDRTKIPGWVMDAHGGADLPPWDCMFANEINIDKDYFDETALAEGKTISGMFRIVVTSPEDRVDLDREFQLNGPAVVYLRRRIIMPERRKAWLQLGNNGPVKMWLNGQCILTMDQSRCGNVGDGYAEAVLDKGINTIAVKVARWSDSFAFRFGIKNHNGEHFHQCYWTTDFESVIPEQEELA